MKPQEEKAGQIYGQRTDELNGQRLRMEKINIKVDLSVGTWNILSLYHTGAVNMLLDQLNNYSAPARNKMDRKRYFEK